MPAESTIDAEKLLRFLYQCPVGIAEIDATGRITMLNGVGTQLLMTLTHDGRLTNLFDLLGPPGQVLREDVAAFEPSHGEVCRERRISVESAAPGAGPRSLSMTLIRMDPDSFMAAYSDVSVLQQQEQQIREALEKQAYAHGKAQMAATVLHDIGNAVTGIGTRVAKQLGDTQWPEYQQIQRLTQLVERMRPQFDQILGSDKAKALLALLHAINDALDRRRTHWQDSLVAVSRSVSHIQDILNVHRAYAQGSADGSRATVSLTAVLDDALAIHRSTLRQRSIEVVRSLPADLPRVSVDRTQMVRVLLNLIKNSTEAFDDESTRARRIEVRARVDDTHLVLEVSDNAIGFDPERAEDLVRTGYSTRPDGSGLGLANCQRIIEAHGGRLNIESPGLGQGSCVRIELPLELESSA